MGFDPVQAFGAKDTVAVVFEELAAGFTQRGEKGQFGQAAEADEKGWAGQNQAISDSLFSWQSMQRDVQGSAFRRFFPISF